MKNCSILNGKYKPIKTGDGIISISKTSTSAKNSDGDGNGDAVIYPASSAITIDGAEILPSGGKIALFGSTHILSSVYNYSSSNQTPLYNRDVIRWLSKKGKVKFEDIAQQLTIGNIANDKLNAEIYKDISIRHTNLEEGLLRKFDKMSLTESLPEIISTLKKLTFSQRRSISPTIRTIMNRARTKCFGNIELMERVRPQLEELERIYNSL